jgi:L-seryl-tRNA(Ser) seleniumtransferase
LGADELQKLPSISRLLELVGEAGPFPHVLSRMACRSVVESERRRLLAGGEAKPEAELVLLAASEAGRLSSSSLFEVINATGIILHTAFGRACLPAAARAALASVAEGYCSLQWDQETGSRGERDSHVEWMVRELTGAEAATIVNNNSGATLLMLAALARGGEVVVSRGQLVEIGGSFRIPDVMRQSGAVMREVGCTNRTHLKDYRSAIGPQTAALLRVHPSNYRIRGFTSEVPLPDLVALGREHGIPVLDDLGAGALADLSLFGLPTEPTVARSIEEGASVVCFSGDKLIGGPQAGVIVGSRDLVDRIRKHPLARALRVCKLTLAAMEATLKLFLEDEQSLRANHPLYAMLGEPHEEVRARAEALLGGLALPDCCTAAVVPSDSYMGSGSLPDSALPSWAVSIRCPGPDELAAALRSSRPAVSGRIEDDALVLDMRTVFERQVAPLAKIVASAASALWA